MSGAAPLVLAARELRPLLVTEPEWPRGARTRWIAREDPLPEEDRVVGLIPLLSREIGPGELDRLPALEVVANYAVGYDNIDLGAAAARGVTVTNTPDVLTEATADLTWALLLAAARRLREGLDLAVSGRWGGWAPDQLLGMGLRDRTLGILGAGRIGTAVARRAPPFGMEIAYWSRSSSAEIEGMGGRRAGPLEELLQGCDVVSVHLPLTGETRGLLGSEELARMADGSILVNTARGEIVDPEALTRALREGPLAAAGLDVYPEEPEIPPALRELPNAFVLPHVGSATWRARREMWNVASANVRRVLAGREPLTPVPPTTGERRDPADPGPR
jgi:glyoxylate reductase